VLENLVGQVSGGGDGKGQCQCVLDDLRRDDLAGTAPRSEAVEHKQRVLCLKRLLPVGLAAHKVSTKHTFASRMTSCFSGETPRRHTARRVRDRTHEVRLCTPSLLIVAVFEKNFGVKSGRYRVAAEAGTMVVAVRARAVVSKVLVKSDIDGPTMIYKEQGVRQGVEKSDFKDGMHWATG
jgi:hypothetical protein